MPSYDHDILSHHWNSVQNERKFIHLTHHMHVITNLSHNCFKTICTHLVYHNINCIQFVYHNISFYSICLWITPSIYIQFVYHTINIHWFVDHRNSVDSISQNINSSSFCVSQPALWRRELTPYSQRAHLNYLTMGSFWGHSANSQRTYKMSSHCELAVSFLWVCSSHSKLTATISWWAHRMISQVGHIKLTVWAANS